MKLINYAMGALLIALIILLLTVTKTLLIPFVIAVFLFVVLKNSGAAISRRLPRFIKIEEIRSYLGYIISFIFLGIFITVTYQVINDNIGAFVEESPKYQEIISTKMGTLMEKYFPQRVIIEEPLSDEEAITVETTTVITSSDTTIIYDTIRSDSLPTDDHSPTVVNDSIVVVNDSIVVGNDSIVVVNDTTLVVSDSTLVVSDSTLVVSDSTLVVSDSTLVVNDSTLVVNDSTLVVNDSTLVVNDSTLVVNDSTVVVNDSTVVVNDSPVVVNDTAVVIAEVSDDDSEWRNDSTGIGALIPEIPDFKWKEKINQLLPQIHLPEIGTAAIGNIPFQDIFANVSKSITGIAKNAVWIFIYLMFLFMESKHFKHKMDRIQDNNPLLMHKLLPAMTQINHDLIEYIKVKTVASIATGFLSFVVLSIFDVDFASFWGFVIFILNYIPTVGSIVAVIFPILLAFVQFDTVAPVFGLTGLLISIQFLIGNFLEPRFLGKTLNLSPLVILISLGVWGKIWGVIGMFLSVPIMVSLNIILAQFEQTRNIAIFLSANGNIRVNDDDEDE